MDIIDVTRLLQQFKQETGLMPNAIIVDENPNSLRTFAGLSVITDETAAKPLRIAFVLDV
jgi:hypothetical protein